MINSRFPEPDVSLAGYELAPDADEDLELIIRYTLSEWGYDQAEKYVSQLSQCFAQIADRKNIGRGLSPALQGVDERARVRSLPLWSIC